MVSVPRVTITKCRYKQRRLENKSPQSSPRFKQRSRGSAGFQHRWKSPSKARICVPLCSRGGSAAKLPDSESHQALTSPSQVPPIPPGTFYFPQHFYCSEEMSQDISFSPSINIASPKCNYQGQSSTSVC